MDVFRLPVPEWTDDFVVALKSIGQWFTQTSEPCGKQFSYIEIKCKKWYILCEIL